VDAIVNRAVGALKLRSNWIQLAKFGVVGASGYAINLAAYTLLLGLGAHSAAAISFILAAASNYWWNRRWTFAETKGHFGYQGLRFLAVSAVALIANQIWLVVFLDWFGWGKVISQALALALVVPLNFLGNKLWSFRR
jgi:putative flippase GtrA